MSSNIGLVVNPKSGFVGIGTGRPSTLLHVDGNMLAAGTITASNLSILGDFVTLNTITSNTEQMVIQNAGTGPALKVTQTGAHPIADFYDDGQVLAMRIADGGNVGIGTATPTSKLHVNGDVTITSTGALIIPRGTTAQRPTNPAAGMMRYNNTEGYIETYEAVLSTWIPISTFIGVLATGGTVTEILVSGVQYRVHTFTSVGTSSFQVLRGGQVEYLIVAGGGGGGRGYDGGGGGAGGLITGLFTPSPQSYSIVIGGGGAASTNDANPGSSGSGSSGFFATALGGGGGGSYPGGGPGRNGLTGGSGGGGVRDAGPGNGTSGQGFIGGSGLNVANYAGGGGGATQQGGNATSTSNGNGGNGYISNINGISTAFGGGGAGAGSVTSTALGGSGGGGDSVLNGTNGLGGGGGGGRVGVTGGGGGSGIVIIRYRIG